MTLTLIKSDTPAFEHNYVVGFPFTSRFMTDNPASLYFMATVRIPPLADLSGSQRYYASRGQISYTEIVDMTVELLRMSVQAEVVVQDNRWHAHWDRAIYADEVAHRLQMALKHLTGVAMTVEGATVNIRR
jgi:hypothetical protein